MPNSFASGTTELRQNRLERDELEMYQRRALRSWRDSDWLARTQPMVWDRLADFPDEIWLHLIDSSNIAQQTPGAIVVGCQAYTDDLAQGQERRPDIYWSFADGIPAADASTDRIIVSASHLDPAPAQRLREIARALRVGGRLLLRGGVSAVASDAFDDLGFAHTEDDAGTSTWELTKKTIRFDDLGEPIIQQTVLGTTGPASVRRPTPYE